eukprot:CAMPEP_0119330808 /NCGR_PEP_ID=MMETSP1333-20130426/79054_1 /TAXON_ID=418940 /ORGANISM="Scyphosphaera apsteinii, Strain RCC1455" /LENGTH=341 /DNA_ID=CAMNT_0007340269 /DNA_START=134 /DNA_END=1159 /DNA_ORIENTATION=-
MASRIADAFLADKSLQTMHEFCECAAGSELLTEFERVNHAKYPHILDEVAGIAAGSGQPARLVLLANLAQEFSTFVPKAAPVVGCTDCHVLTECESAWGHTEDVASVDEVLGYIIHSTLLDNDAVVTAYTAYAYPGCVAGWAWGFNQHGVAFSINALTPASLCAGLAASFISRDVLDARSMDDAIVRATVPLQGGGARFNLGSVTEPERRVLIEASPRGCELRQLVPGERCTVCNVYLFGDAPNELEGRRGPYAESSHRRLARATELTCDNSASSGLEWIKRVLGDVAYSDFPIWRSSFPPDYALTDHMVTFDLRARRVQVFRQSEHRPVNTFYMQEGLAN